MVAAYLIDPARRGYPLDELATDEAIGAEVDGADGGAERAVIARVLAERQRARLEEDGLTGLLHDVELPLVEVLVEMERAGVKLDVEQVRSISKRVGDQVAQLEREIWLLAGEEFTIGSPQQLATILFDQLGLSKKRRGKTGFSTDARVLAAIRDEHEIVPKIEQWRELSKLKSTYLDAFPELVDERSRLHTTFSQTTATTGRLSSTDPNLQNIPIRTELGREIRACFVAEEGHRLISADYSQVELRLLAHISGEEVLKEIFRRGRGRAHGHRGRILGEEARSRSRHALQGQDGQLRHRLRPLGLRPRRPAPDPAGGGAGVHRPLPRAVPGREGVHRRDRRARQGERLRPTLFGRIRRDAGAAGAPAPDPDAGRAVRGEHGDPGHRCRHHQGRDGPHTRARFARPAWRPRSCSRSTTSCCSRRRSTRSSRRRRS